jgi:hypothetical protein
VSRWESWLFATLHALLALTGGLYFWMKYLLGTDDPFAIVNHPWQPLVLAAHVVVAPLGMVAFGIALRSHVLERFTTNGPAGRCSGWIALLGFGVAAGSGYLLQVVDSPAAHRVLVWTHLTTSIVFVFGYCAHVVAGWRLTHRLSQLRRLAAGGRAAAGW